MLGSLWEWCSDYYQEDYYGSSPEFDPQGAGSGWARVVRGGAYRDSMAFCRTAFRGYVRPSFTRYDYGFRLVRSEE